MMRRFSCILLFVFIGLSGYCQNYIRDAGIKFGDNVAFSYRKFYKETMAVDFFGGIRYNGLYAGAMREFFQPALTKYSDNFKLYYGYGIHAGFNYTNHYKFLNREYRYNWVFSPIFGMDALVGIEYYFPEVPIIVSADIQPYFEFSLNRIFQLDIMNVYLSVKYRF
jgi:hypothetical protein